MVFKALHFLSHHPKPLHSLSNFNFQCLRTFIDNIDINYIRDRGLDHAVEKEKDLKPMINLKNFIKLEPTKSLPLSTIVGNKEKLDLPYRPIEFIRKYPSIFEEYFPGNVGIHPHVRLTQEILNLDAEEKVIFESDSCRNGAANRLLKLLMLCRVNEIPLKLIDRLKWDLGLPDNYVSTLVPEFPDYFQVKKIKNLSRLGRVDGGLNDGILELVCWSGELAVSVLENKAMKGDMGYQKGMPIAFPLQFSKGFELDKRLKKWIDEWQRIPYISPYENASHLQPNSDESDKWVCAVLHEILHILVSKKTERDNILCLGEYMGIRSRFKRALVHHPGIFYLSSKIGTYTVVLREGYKRDLLIEKHPLMDMRNKYIHLMHTVKEVQKSKSVSCSSTGEKQIVKAGGEVKQEGDEDDEQEEDVHDENSNEKATEGDEEEDNKSLGGRLRGGWRRHSNVGRRKARRSAI